MVERSDTTGYARQGEPTPEGSQTPALRPLGGRINVSAAAGGVASLNLRLIAATPPGSINCGSGVDQLRLWGRSIAARPRWDSVAKTHPSGATISSSSIAGLPSQWIRAKRPYVVRGWVRQRDLSQGLTRPLQHHRAHRDA